MVHALEKHSRFRTTNITIAIYRISTWSSVLSYVLIKVAESVKLSNRPCQSSLQNHKSSSNQSKEASNAPAMVLPDLHTIQRPRWRKQWHAPSTQNRSHYRTPIQDLPKGWETVERTIYCRKQAREGSLVGSSAKNDRRPTSKEVFLKKEPTMLQPPEKYLPRTPHSLCITKQIKEQQLHKAPWHLSVKCASDTLDLLVREVQIQVFLTEVALLAKLCIRYGSASK